MVTQRKALLAWTGHTLSVTPTINRRMSIAHWGNSEVTGRGLVALAGPGQIYKVALREGEEYVAHPGNVVAYTITQHPPSPYRFHSSSLRFQIPSVFSKIDIKFVRVMKGTDTWKGFTRMAYGVRTWTRRTIWGDRLFLKFRGPTTLLLSSRAARVSDVLTARDVDEIAEAEPGSVVKAVTLLASAGDDTPKQQVTAPTGMNSAL